MQHFKPPIGTGLGCAACQEYVMQHGAPRDIDHTPNLADAAEMLWITLANVSGGDWTQQSPEWQEAAARWRDYYFAAIHGVNVKEAPHAGGQ